MEAYSKLKSESERDAITFLLLQNRLLQFLLQRLDNGDFTERGLARVLGVSQPQIHNVLKRKRRLQASLADRILQKFEVDVLDLLDDQELRSRLVAGPIQRIFSINRVPSLPTKGLHEKRTIPESKAI